MTSSVCSVGMKKNVFWGNLISFILGKFKPNHKTRAPDINIHCQECGGMCLFAEDSTYTKLSKDPAEVQEVMEDKYKVITKWMASNKLVLNTDKTHLLVMASTLLHKFLRPSI